MPVHIGIRPERPFADGSHLDTHAALMVSVAADSCKADKQEFGGLPALWDGRCRDVHGRFRIG